MRAIGDDGVVCPHLAPVGAAESHHAVVALQQEARLELAQEPGAHVLCPPQQEVIERPSVTDERHVLRTRHNDIMTTRGDQPKPTDQIGLAYNGLADAQGIEYGAALRRDRAAAGLVARKI